MADTDAGYAALLATLEKVQQHDFVILKLSESISVSQKDLSDITRNSDASSAFDTSTPSALQADLSHYKELFSKLRFSYLEQVTKEKFLRAITEEPPLIIEPSENAALEQDLTAAKSALQASKASVDAILTQLEELSRRLAGEYKSIAGYVALARDLPRETVAIEGRVGELRREQEKGGEMRMPLSDTIAVLSEREAELRGLERELEEMEREVPRRRKVLEGLEREVEPMEVERRGLERFASEAVRMREEREEAGAERETMGRWYKSVFEGLEALLPG